MSNGLDLKAGTLPAAPFHGYRIVALALFCQFYAIGLSVYIFGLFVVPISEELEASRALIGLGPPLSFIMSSLLSPLVGSWIDRQHTRRVMLAGCTCLSAGLCLISVTTSLWQMGLIMCLLMGPGAVMLGVMPSTSLIINWFERKRGMALGIASAGAPLGGICLPLLVAVLIEAFGWRQSLLFCGTLLLVTLLPAIYRLAMAHPQQLGQFRDNDSLASQDTQQAHKQTTAVPDTSTIIRDPRFWVSAAILGLLNFASILVLTTLVPYAQDIGFSSTAAAALFSAKACASFAGMFAFGYLSDRLGALNTFSVIILVYTIGWPGFLFPDTLWLVVFATLVSGFAAGGVLPLVGSLIASLFGASAYARSYSLMRLAMLPLVISPAPLSGYIFDTTGSYLPVMSATLVIFPVILLLLLKLKPARD